MVLMKVRRWEDNVLLNDDCKAFSGLGWRYSKPVHTTIAGNSIPQITTVMERWWDATFLFDSDDPVNNFDRYNTLTYDANNDEYFAFVDIDGSVYKCQIMGVIELSRQDFPTAHVAEVKCVFKQEGYIPPKIQVAIDPIEPVLPVEVWTGGAWSTTVSYSMNEVVSRSGLLWKSKVDSNLNHVPPTPPTASNTYWIQFHVSFLGAWSSATSYDLDDIVSSNLSLYKSLVNANLNHPPPALPVTSTAYWEMVAHEPISGP